MTKEQKEPAFPCTPLQDNFGRLVVPVAGMSKYELVLKDFMCCMTNSFIRNDGEQLIVPNGEIILAECIDLTNLYFKHLNEKNEPDTTTKPTFTIQ